MTFNHASFAHHGFKSRSTHWDPPAALVSTLPIVRVNKNEQRWLRYNFGWLQTPYAPLV